MTSFRANKREETWFSKRTFKDFIQYNKWFNLLGIVFISMLFIIPYIFNFNELIKGVFIGFGAALTGVLIFKFYLFNLIKNKISALVSRIIGNHFEFYKSKIGPLSIAKVPFGTLSVLLKDRVLSLTILMQEVFLKIVRRLNYNKLYENKDYHFRRISTLIRGLTEQDFVKYKASIPDNSGITYDNFVGKNIADVVNEASGFGTTLWFTETELLDDVLHKLVATGQMTMCLNMLIYLNKWIKDDEGFFGRLSLIDQAEVKALKEMCMEDWKKFREEPMWMV
jgi:hypothetical protein